jgi:hypothetical protein
MRVSRAADAYTAKAKATATATATRTRSPATNKAGAGNSSSRCREAEKCPSPVVRAGEGARVIILRQRLPSSSVQQQTRRHVARSSSHQASITCPTGMVRRKDCQDMPVWSAAPATPATPATPVIACRNDSQDARRAAETTASLAHMVRATLSTGQGAGVDRPPVPVQIRFVLPCACCALCTVHYYALCNSPSPDFLGT